MLATLNFCEVILAASSQTFDNVVDDTGTGVTEFFQLDIGLVKVKFVFATIDGKDSVEEKDTLFLARS